MLVRYETHRLIDDLQREKLLETQAKQEQVMPVAVPAEEVTVSRIPISPSYNLDKAERNRAHFDVPEYVTSRTVKTQQWVSTHFAIRNLATGTSTTGGLLSC